MAQQALIARQNYPTPQIIILPLCWISVGYLYAQTLSHIWRQRRIAPLITPVIKSYERLRRRLLLFALIFFFAWCVPQPKMACMFLSLSH